MTVIRTSVKRPLPQPAAVAFAIDAEGFVVRVKASLLTVMFQYRGVVGRLSERAEIHEGID